MHDGQTPHRLSCVCRAGFLLSPCFCVSGFHCADQTGLGSLPQLPRLRARAQALLCWWLGPSQSPGVLVKAGKCSSEGKDLDV